MTIDEIEKWAVSELKSQHHDVDWLESFGRHFRLVVRGACERAREPITEWPTEPPKPEPRLGADTVVRPADFDTVWNNIASLTARVQKIEKAGSPLGWRIGCGKCGADITGITAMRHNCQDHVA